MTTKNSKEKCSHERIYGYCIAKMADDIYVLCHCPDCGEYLQRPISELQSPRMPDEDES